MEEISVLHKFLFILKNQKFREKKKVEVLNEIRLFLKLKSERKDSVNNIIRKTKVEGNREKVLSRGWLVERKTVP